MNVKLKSNTFCNEEKTNRDKRGNRMEPTE